MVEHMQALSVDEAIAVLKATPPDKLLRRGVEEDTPMTLKQAIAAARKANRRNWIRISYRKFHLRMEADEEVFTFPFVDPPAEEEPTEGG